MSIARDVVEVLARALTDKPDLVHVVESQHQGATLIELFVAPGRGDGWRKRRQIDHARNSRRAALRDNEI
jgi:hypothetical protein